jgi:hypothetical protein
MKRIVAYLAVLAILGSVWPSAAAAGEKAPAVQGDLYRSVLVGEDGDTIVSYHQRPVSYVDGEGQLRPIDVTLRATEGGYENHTNTLAVRFPERVTNGWEVDLQGGGIHFQTLGVGLATEEEYREAATPDGSAEATLGDEPGTLRYDEIFPGMSDTFQVRRGQVEHIVRVGSLEDLPEGEGDLALRYEVTLNGGLNLTHHPLVVMDEPEGGMVSLPFASLENREGEVVGVIPTPAFWDSGDPVSVAGGNLEWESTGEGEGVLTLRFSRTILEGMTYPVNLDPQVSQMLAPLNTVTGSAWGHIEDPVTGRVLYNVRFNGIQFQIGAYTYDFGPPLGVLTIQDCVATPAFDVGSLPGHVTDAWLEYEVIFDDYDSMEKVVVNDHKTDTLNDQMDSWVFINNIADGRNVEDYNGSPDFSKDKEYLHAFHGPQTFDVFSDRTAVKLTGRALHDIHKSVDGEMDTPSALPLATGLFAIGVRDTSEYNNVYGMWLWDPQLKVRTN